MEIPGLINQSFKKSNYQEIIRRSFRWGWFGWIRNGRQPDVSAVIHRSCKFYC